MTTVINLNLLNFIKLKQNNSTVNDTRFNTYLTDDSESHSREEEDIIDVTPTSTVVEQNQDAIQKYSNLAVHKPAPAVVHKRSASPAVTYDRQGNSVDYSQQKGVYVDAYA